MQIIPSTGAVSAQSALGNTMLSRAPGPDDGRTAFRQFVDREGAGPSRSDVENQDGTASDSARDGSREADADASTELQLDAGADMVDSAGPAKQDNGASVDTGVPRVPDVEIRRESGPETAFPDADPETLPGERGASPPTGWDGGKSGAALLPPTSVPGPVSRDAADMAGLAAKPVAKGPDMAAPKGMSRITDTGEESGQGRNGAARTASPADGAKNLVGDMARDNGAGNGSTTGGASNVARSAGGSTATAESTGNPAGSTLVSPESGGGKRALNASQLEGAGEPLEFGRNTAARGVGPANGQLPAMAGNSSGVPFGSGLPQQSNAAILETAVPANAQEARAVSSGPITPANAATGKGTLVESAAGDRDIPLGASEIWPRERSARAPFEVARSTRPGPLSAPVVQTGASAITASPADPTTLQSSAQGAVFMTEQVAVYGDAEGGVAAEPRANVEIRSAGSWSAAAPPHEPASRQGAMPGPAQQLADATRAHLSGAPPGTVDVALHPEELGRVRLVFTPADAGLIVTIQAERPETLDMLRRHVDLLELDLRGNGFAGLSFDFGSGSDQGTSAKEKELDRRALHIEPVSPDETATPEPAHAHSLRVSGNADAIPTLDLRI